MNSGITGSTVWTVDFETQVCQLYLFISANAAQEKEESAAAHWGFKVYSPYSNETSPQ
jgi:hypothetical protein